MTDIKLYNFLSFTFKEILTKIKPPKTMNQNRIYDRKNLLYEKLSNVAKEKMLIKRVKTKKKPIRIKNLSKKNFLVFSIKIKKINEIVNARLVAIDVVPSLYVIKKYIFGIKIIKNNEIPKMLILI